MLNQSCAVKNILQDIHFEDTYAARGSKSGKNKLPRVIAITGGKGGVGKTLTTANIGLSLVQLGVRTLLIDGDFGLANLDVVLNMQPQATIDDVLAGERELRDVLVTGPHRIRLLPAASGVLRAGELGRMEKLILLDQLESLEEEFDIVLIDTPAGVAGNVRYWTSAAAEVLLVATPEPTSLADAYATMKILNQTTKQTRFKLVVNMVRNEEEGLRVYEKLSTLADEYLNVSVEYLGAIVFDEFVKASVRERVPCVLKYPCSPAARGFASLAQALVKDTSLGRVGGSVQGLWRRMLANEHLELLV